jgi:PTS system cellobiose-specific IIB component
MNKLNILLACGTGMSSGFLARKVNEAAKKRGYDAHVEAVSEAEVESMIEDFDVLLIGPHLDYIAEELRSITESFNVPMAIISKETYGALNGEAALDEALAIIK